MFGKPSLITRIAVGKAVGFAVGLVGFLFMSTYLPEADAMLSWGILLWYTTLGAIIGVFGVFTHHPILKLPMPWWCLGPLLGAWMNFVLMLFVYDIMQEMLVVLFAGNRIMQSPLWLVFEGAVIGLAIGYFATRFGGEGPETVGEMED